ncbi:MAG: restriction endonuclease subunit S [Sodaliphilus sp.]|nr:restriction endonuclease subunit S [Bacteroidales bacterium]MDY5867886.1 restriction endonuclease subunit S [Sodaliphilus sp.]
MEWKLSELSVDGKGHYGIGAPAIPYDKNKPTYLRITDINDDGTINFLDLKSVDDEDSNKYLLKENDIVFARTGNSTGRSYFYQKEHGDFVYAGFLIKFSIDPQKVNPKILKYYTHSQEYYNWVKSFDTGGTRGNINAKTFGDMPISLPKRCVQDKIVGILSALDSKIENNNKINANLETQAEALFKSWFVDFTPFKDQPFVDSELGPIPQGWKVGKLGDIGEIVGGSTPSKSKPEYYTTHGIAWLTPKDLSTSKAKFTSRGEIDITDEGYNSTSTKLMPRGSVLFSSRAPIGYLTIAKNEICTNQGFKSLVPNGAGTGFIYYTLRHLTPQIENRATGSTFKEASATLMRSVETIVPPTSILNKFEELLRPILQFQEKKEEENQRLAALRDTLLPKLMSGEIKL